jgi:hypothetical protein
MIKSKNVTNITNAEYRSHLINTILNSTSLSNEIYNKLSPLEDLEVDSIKGISKWKSDISFDKLVEFRIVLIKWLLYSAFVMLVTFLLLIMDIKLRYFKKLSLKLN